MIKRREKTKREHVHLGIEIFEKRYQAKDFNGYLLAEYTNNAVKNSRFAIHNISNLKENREKFIQKIILQIFKIDRLLHHYMGINIQGNNQINTGRIRERIMLQVGIQQVCHRYTINMVTMTLMEHFIIIIEKKNGNIRNESTKTNVKNKRPVSETNIKKNNNKLFDFCTNF